MKKLIFLFLAIAFFSNENFAQVKRQANNPFLLKGEVIDGETNMPIPKVNVEILGGQYTTTNFSGRFSISAKIGDELVIKSDDFVTVYHTIKENDFITIRVEKARETATPVVSKRPQIEGRSGFSIYLDSAKFFLKKEK